MASNVSIIGKTTRIRGRVTGAVDLEVQGFVDGVIAVGGDVTVDTHGMVSEGVQGRKLVVRGAVKGDLVGEEAILLEDGARVVGDIRAPRVVIAPGALVRGFVDTGHGDGAPAKASRTAAAARPAAAAPARAAVPAAPLYKPEAAPAPKTQAKHGPAPQGGAHAAHSGGNNAPHGGPRRPPPPVVPALKKAKGQIAKKKER
ncbi:MAG TPA: polymer-forming cytoskeletal protein [Polyangiaceae bacterium]|jgi:cytoskeletal protein CcmA (bactofilin family)